MSEESKRVLECFERAGRLNTSLAKLAVTKEHSHSALVLARQVEALEEQADEYEKACDEIMQERDGHSEALLKCSELLGGPEWSGKMPPEHPPNSGDLNRDVPALISELNAKVEALEDELFKRGAMNGAPCFCCGYNGPGYYQPDSHPCAERHHRLYSPEEA